MNVTFNSGCYGNDIEFCGDRDHISQNATVTLNPGQFQCDTSNNYPSLNVGRWASNNTVTCSGGGSYKFLGPVKICGHNTVNLQPGSYFGGIDIEGDSANSPTVNFAPGTYVIGGGGFKCSGKAVLQGTGVHFCNKRDDSGSGFASDSFRVGEADDDDIECHLHAPSDGDFEGCLFHQDVDISNEAHECHVRGNKDSDFDGAVYCPGAALHFCGKSSGAGYTVLVADTVELKNNTSLSNMNVNCNYAALSHGAPIKSNSLYE
jgi:hypothetical protein